MHNRDDERAALLRKLDAGISVHMPAPRRIGKTWTINRLATDLRNAGWVAVEVDVEGMREPAEFARDLCKRIEGQSSLKGLFKSHVAQRIGNLLGGTWDREPLEALGKVDPIEFAEILVASLDAEAGKAAIIIDEIAYFFLALAEKDAAEAHAFAYKLRAIQQRYKNVRWLLTGSIGLDTIARRYGLEGAFVDLDVFVLEPFTKPQARSYMRDPAVQQQFNHVFDAADADLNAMFDELGWLAPYYLKLVANEVRPSIGGVGGEPAQATLDDLKAAFDKLLQPNRRSAFAVWGEHIRKNLPAPDQAIAGQLLRAISQTPQGETETTLQAQATLVHGGAHRRQVKEILSMLVNDGLITKAGDRYAFRSGLIRRYWQEYEGE